MGVCLCKTKHRKSSTLPSADELGYKRMISAQILNYTYSSKIQIKTTEPLVVFGKEVSYQGKMFWISGCVLPGIDPRGHSEKVCQDMCFVLDTSDSILLGLFDGHGDNGAEVVKYCSDFIQNFFLRNKDSLLKKPKKFLKVMTTDCDKSLKRSKIDILLSGSTLILVLIYDHIIYHANLGDSRVILATENTISYDTQLPKTPVNQEEIRIHRKIKARRSIPKVKGIKATQLTKDQKPEDPEEMNRILKFGGIIERVCDASGNKFGPYRVWRANSRRPGLAMSRSIGDFIAKDIGVSSDPVINTHQLDAYKDHFVILASDGIWDVMDNDDVVSFVMGYKQSCRHHQHISTVNERIKPDNTTIAHLICEEARLRWVSLVESEDVIIDDISCVILDFNPLEDPISPLLLVPVCKNQYDICLHPAESEDTEKV